MEPKGQQLVHCPSCGFNGVRRRESVLLQIFGALTLAGIIIPVIGWMVLFPIGVIGFLPAGVYEYLISKKTRMVCTQCKHKFVISTELYKTLKKHLKN